MQIEKKCLIYLHQVIFIQHFPLQNNNGSFSRFTLDRSGFMLHKMVLHVTFGSADKTLQCQNSNENDLAGIQLLVLKEGSDKKLYCLLLFFFWYLAVVLLVYV